MNLAISASQLGALPLWAVMRKETQVFFCYRSWIVGLMVWPVLFPLSYLFGGRALAGANGEGMAAFAEAASTTNYVGFIVIGTGSHFGLFRSPSKTEISSGGNFSCRMPFATMTG